ncbi:catabolite repressor/activator [Avibacterium volantium]|uniref:Catabolite repressor/activator n=1 Tax=Avibacterium volantium TaxID=762 RepID=A0A447SRY1_AVIVO|nr:catabolite repressor/activator [Avibacterium volantium]VEB24507.1 Catabolite repressor/activator [Avibacterium volantium]
MKLDELAKLAGVSRTTVSYVVNGKAKQYRVSDKTIEKVQSLIKEYDFKPNAMAAGLRAGKTNTIGLIIPDFENMSYARIAHQLEQKFREKGYQLLIACSNDNPNNEMVCAKHLFQRKIDALIVSTSLPADNLFYQQSKVPVFGFDRKISGDNVINVLSDDRNDAYRLAQDLFKQQSFNNVLFLGALPELPTSKERELGFRQALKERSENAVEFLYSDQFHRDSAAQTFEQWLVTNSLPDALFVTSLTLLQGIFQVLLRQHKGIPQQLVIATFGDHEMLELLGNKTLCAVQDHKKIADKLLDLVLERLNHKSESLPEPTKVLRDLVYHC